MSLLVLLLQLNKRFKSLNPAHVLTLIQQMNLTLLLTTTRKTRAEIQFSSAQISSTIDDDGAIAANTTTTTT